MLINAWKQFPEQVKRLSVLVVLAVAALITARIYLVPADFGKHGHFRASAVDEIVAQEIVYAGREACAECHEDEVESQGKGYHRDLSCEVCHGPAAGHVEDLESVKLLVPRGRGRCPLCHEFLPSRPTGFPQIVTASHNPMKPCISCHDPHDPVPPETPRECSACHATIARTKAISHHVYVECTHCHETPKQHRIDPRRYPPGKPTSREFCGGCHAEGALEAKGVPRVDLAMHESRYVCWQCHYPHLPEAP